MMWTALGIGGTALLGGALGANATKKAAAAQEQATRAQIAEQSRQYDLTRKDQAPFMGTGVSANSRLAALMGLSPAAKQSPDELRAQIASLQQQKAATTDARGNYDPIFDQRIREAQSQLDDPVSAADNGSLVRKFSASDLQADPVYQSGLQFGLNEGTGAINSRAIAGGGYDSGATIKALTRYAEDYGSTKAEGAYNRYNTDNTNIYNRLAGVSGAGQTATNAVQTAGTNATNATTQALSDAGNARAAGIVGGANAWGGSLSGVSGALQGYQNNKILQQLLKKNTSTPAFNYAGPG